MNDFMRDKFTPKKGEGTIPLYGEIIAGGTVSQHYIFEQRVWFARTWNDIEMFADFNKNPYN